MGRAGGEEDAQVDLGPEVAGQALRHMDFRRLVQPVERSLQPHARHDLRLVHRLVEPYGKRLAAPPKGGGGYHCSQITNGTIVHNWQLKYGAVIGD